MKTILNFLLSIFVICCNYGAFASGIANSGKPIVPDTLGRILINQVGYQPNATKIALLSFKADKFQIIEQGTGNVVFTGKPGKLKYWEFSGDTVCTADFTKLTKPGKYHLHIPGRSLNSYEFIIDSNVYNDVAKAAIKAFYLNRSAIDIPREFGGKWARPGGHPDTAVYIHASAASDKRPEGTKISSPGGWYDAGDYNKYIVNSGITTYTLLLFCQMYPEYIRNFSFNIPESKNELPDVIDELLFNLRWMLTMQDPSDGGVYHKLTNKGFDGFVMPDKATEPRYVVLKSTAASLDFAATMAMASRVFEKSGSKDLSQLAKTCLEAAKKAYGWSKANHEIFYANPAGIQTGTYDDKKLNDEFFWASVEIGLATNDPSLVNAESVKSQVAIVPSWDSVGALGMISLSLTGSKEFSEHKKKAQEILLGYTDGLVKKSESSPYLISLDFFKWGSTSDIANMGVLKIVSFYISGNKKYLSSLQGEVDYMLGRNATRYSFVTGFGGKQAVNIHHRPSAADGVAEPYPGFLIGGPNLVTFTDCPDVKRSKFPAKSYVDALCSYSTNEIAINWNAPLFFVMGALDAMKK